MELNDLKLLSVAFSHDNRTIDKCIDKTIEYCIDHFKGKFSTLNSTELTDILIEERFTDNINFVGTPYNLLVDDHANDTVPFEKQEYLNKDYRKYLLNRFPLYTSYSRVIDGKQQLPVINHNIIKQLPLLEGVNWTNQTLSYTRLSNISNKIYQNIIKPLIDDNLFNKKQITIVDATAGIGGDTLSFAMNYSINKVIAYEISKDTYNMLRNNIELYRLNNRIITKNKRFDYDIPNNSLVIIDPPFESSYKQSQFLKDTDINKNFTLSIDNIPIYAVAQKCLDRGARCVLITCPKTFRYNFRYAVDNDQHVSVFLTPKNNKIFVVMRLEDGNKLAYVNFESYKL